MYESPISVYKKLTHEIAKQKDEYICQAIVKVGVDVNKEELIKALAYDREQYSKGFADGFEEGVKTFAEKVKSNLIEKGFYPAIVKCVLEEAQKELVGDDNA